MCTPSPGRPEPRSTPPSPSTPPTRTTTRARTRTRAATPRTACAARRRTRIRRRAAGLTLAAIDQALNDAHADLRTADRYADAGDESAFARAAAAYEEWQRIRAETAAQGGAYDRDRDLGLQRAQTAAGHRRDVAQCAAEAAHDARQHTDTAHRRLAGAAADPLYTALARAGLYTLTDDDHQAVRELTRHLDAATVRQVVGWLERTRAGAHAPAPDRTRPTRPVVRRSGL
ncbi:hypothetical protein K353_06104 [Kitasatospora sp. SolWspMP-SS2h]|uniref:hypothetical protein n=1 Tax=Kitasatospora sp. SolWspMP-SS2h TaxID=1305729 RepID=UPI000DB98F69|nr:hypothetical protein [Kitasatospora sp. SolWspMP-SS2h]RAJ31753.1 hypothetical protein K353_06104 [Kitasatospora sp. SolWspMP-SS2h]